MKTAYFIDWIPEQCEDIFEILIDTDFIAIIQIERLNRKTEPLVDVIKLKDYKKGLKKIEQIKLAVAIDLAKKDISSKKGV